LQMTAARGVAQLFAVSIEPAQPAYFVV